MESPPVNAPSGTSNTTSTSSTVSNPLQSVSVQINNDLMLKVELGSLVSNTKVTLANASMLHQLSNQNQLVALLSNNLAILHNQQLLKSLTLPLPTEMQVIVANWFKEKKPLADLPSNIQAFLMSKLGLSSHSLSTNLQLLRLINKSLEISFFESAPIAELKLEQNIANKNQELSTLLQFLLPIPLLENETLIVSQQESSVDEENEGTLSFVMNFDLDRLGKLTVEVELKDFELKTRCFCEHFALEKQVKEHWPLLNERLAKLGFTYSNTVAMLKNDESALPSNRLVDIKI